MITINSNRNVHDCVCDVQIFHNRVVFFHLFLLFARPMGPLHLCRWHLASIHSERKNEIKFKNGRRKSIHSFKFISIKSTTHFSNHGMKVIDVFRGSFNSTFMQRHILFLLLLSHRLESFLKKVTFPWINVRIVSFRKFDYIGKYSYSVRSGFTSNHRMFLTHDY